MHNPDLVLALLEGPRVNDRRVTVDVVLFHVLDWLSCVYWLCSLPCASNTAGGASTHHHRVKLHFRGKRQYLKWCLKIQTKHNFFFFFWVFFSSCRTEALLDAMSQTLKSLEDRYLKMKMMILEGVPLDNLKPLSVDTKRLTAATCYRPSLVCRSHVPREETQNKHLLLVSQFDQHFVSFSDLWGFFRWRQAWVLFQVSVIHSWD